jgi:magnesium and cobalt transporter
VPARGEVIRHSSGAEFRVLEADARRIRRIRAKVPSLLAAEAAIADAPKINDNR